VVAKPINKVISDLVGQCLRELLKASTEQFGALDDDRGTPASEKNMSNPKSVIPIRDWNERTKIFTPVLLNLIVGIEACCENLSISVCHPWFCGSITLGYSSVHTAWLGDNNKRRSCYFIAGFG
jgi:hypothetical protein